MKFTDLNLLAIGNTIQITGMIYSGEGKSFLCFLPGDSNDLPLEVLEMTPEEWQTFLRQTDVMEVEVLAKASDGTIAKAILRKSQRQIDTVVQWRVFKRDAYRCRYCGNDNTPLTVDHLVCWEDGGPSIEANLLASCKKCNKIRGNLSYADWLNHPRYVNVSQNLDPATKEANRAILATLDAIPRKVHARSR